MRITSVLIGIGLVFWVKISIEAPNKTQLDGNRSNGAKQRQHSFVYPYTCVHCRCMRMFTLPTGAAVLCIAGVSDSLWLRQCVRVCFFVNGNAASINSSAFCGKQRNVINFHVTWINGL